MGGGYSKKLTFQRGDEVVTLRKVMKAGPTGAGKIYLSPEQMGRLGVTIGGTVETVTEQVDGAWRVVVMPRKPDAEVPHGLGTDPVAGV